MEINFISEAPKNQHRYIFVYNFNFNINSENGKGLTVKNLGASEFTKRENFIIGRWNKKKEKEPTIKLTYLLHIFRLCPNCDHPNTKEESCNKYVCRYCESEPDTEY